MTRHQNMASRGWVEHTSPQQLMELCTKARREHGFAPYVHGNGFIQMNLDKEKRQRAHFWHRDVPRQKRYTGIHNHVFGFMSEIVVGRVLNINHYLEPAVQALQQHYQIFQAYRRQGDDSGLLGTGQMVFISESTVASVVATERYYMPALVFHETFSPEPTATLITKDTAVYQYAPSVLVPFGEDPDNDFDRHAFPEEDLWAIMEKVLAVSPLRDTSGDDEIPF